MSRTILYALQLTFYEHVMRVATQDFTRQQLKGKFWPEYFDSVHVPKQWSDKDHWQVNYIGHAISGGAYTRIWMEQTRTEVHDQDGVSQGDGPRADLDDALEHSVRNRPGVGSVNRQRRV